MSSTSTAVKVALPVLGGGAGFYLFGPIGAAIGAVVGLGIDLLIPSTPTPPTATVIPPPGVVTMVPTLAGMAPSAAAQGLPSTVDINAAVTAVRMMIIGAPSMAIPAASWLKKFQTSAGLPATGQLDAKTRAVLVLATKNGPGGVDGAKLPAKTILG